MALCGIIITLICGTETLVRNTEDQMEPLPSEPFQQLQRFIAKEMRMSHVYQPLMLRTLIANGGWAGVRDIAKAFLALDESQVDYYAEITKRMPARVLAKHGLIERDGDGYRLLPDVRRLTTKQRAQLVDLCDQAVAKFLLERGGRLFAHRRLAIRELSGTDRYEVLKRAGFRCELCGIPADERAIDVDHILPRKHGGGNDRSNLQALCYQCNTNKGDRDDTNFRTVREDLNRRVADCIFCAIGERQVLARNHLAIAIADQFPVTPQHALIIPHRHAETYFDLFEPERRAISLLLDEVRKQIVASDSSVQGFNIGMNAGEAAGQTVMHAHVHLIPRRLGDVPAPRGGVRGVIPGRANY